ncbi:MAG TPA: hypothetical protein ENF17_01910 [Candidatus Aminicenantes bacterium]|nr:hypothetical protein [Candidatus Aminicenantes bacterium]
MRNGSGRLNLQCRSDILLRLSLDFISRHLGTKPIFIKNLNTSPSQLQLLLVEGGQAKAKSKQEDSHF